ncbi:DnaT-like ssDNA-binding domain-containing protein [Pseudomonas sp. ML96]|uniref:DnaT-like ssDNA-binding domain-containing protein n=1 Tax=Pseudomonas sp. ML96 TaxID=1523503 RepID=UPI0015A5A448|nr:DnaT-like ssDNA-binding domain-containing protein [Pseudomonas sp. ML96]
MAGDWIKFELTTLDKPEVCQIAALADIDLDAAVGKLLRVWGWFDQQTESGNAPSVSKTLLDRLVGVTGFCEHMKSVGWMDECEGVISLPHFERHNGKTAKNRLLTAKRVANHKAANAKGNAKANGAGVSGALPREDVDVDKEQQQQGQAPDPAQASPSGPTPAVESWQRFPMSPEWKPDDANLGTHLQLIGVAAELITPEVLAEFVSYWLARSDTANNQAVWCRELVMSAKRRSVRAAAKPAGQPPAAGARTSQHTNLNNQNPTEGLEANSDGTYAL